MMQAFTPAVTVSIAATAASGSATLVAVGVAANQLRICNTGATIVFIRWGVGAQTAVATDMPILPGTVEVFNKGRADTIAAICPGGTTTLYITAGEGN